MTKITNAAGTEIDFDAAAAVMDAEIVAGLGDGHMSGLTAQQAFDAYCIAHVAKYGTGFEADKADPTF